MEEVGGLLERFSEFAKRRIEHAADEKRQGPAFALISDIEFYNAGFRPGLSKPPPIFEALEGPVDILDEDLETSAVARHTARECFSYGFVANFHIGHENHLSVLGLAATSQLQSPAERN